ncbi:MAG: M20/M25/M40 family metallo-hydrolase [Acidobacteria bacterium]|nr:M20/M25/M40 family metallo-hydrolase [Acidobacteriota bacterium]MBP8273027.1 M20/M25/M40 family metallo-hydrolase [Acidobacteriota bacterium]
MKRALLTVGFAALAATAIVSAQSGSAFTPAMANRPDVKQALAYLDANFDRQVDEWIRLTEIPALSTHEQQRAAYIANELKKIPGLQVSTDPMGNLTARRPGTASAGLSAAAAAGSAIVLAVHMDTVHPMDTDLKVKRLPDGTLHAPGVFDNTASIANALQTLRALHAAKITTRNDLLFVFTVQEELGLKGMYYWIDNNPKPAMLVASDGGLPDVNYGALGIYWSKMKFTAPGAHTMNSRNQPHPARAAAQCISDIYTVMLPPATDPVPAIYNVGMMGGGTVVNAIAPENWFTVDLRTIDPVLLKRLDAEIVAKCQAAANMHRVSFTREFIQQSEAGGRPEALASRLNHPVVQTPVAVLKFLDTQATLNPTGSTDANVGVVRGIPSVAIGRSRGGNQHSLSEWADIASAKTGVQQMLLVLTALGQIN